MDNKERILAAALELFYARGYDAVGVQEIADTAGISKPTLYYYFGSKKGLLEQILFNHCEELGIKIDSAAGKEVEFPGKLYEIARCFFDFCYQNCKIYYLMLALFYSGRANEGFQVVYPLIQKYHQQVVAVFDGAADQLGNMNGRQKQFAIGFIGILDHYFMLLNQNRQAAEVTAISDEQTYSIVHQFMYGIYS